MKSKAKHERKKGAAVRVQRVVGLCLADVINLEMACEYMTECGMSQRGRKSLNWQRAFCARLKAELTQPNADFRGPAQ